MTEISEDHRFEWDSDKNEKNKLKHGLSFEQILPVFDDPYFLERYDNVHSSEYEDRYFGLGCVQGGGSCCHFLYGEQKNTNNFRSTCIAERRGGLQ